MSKIKVWPARYGREATQITITLHPDTLAVHADITAAIARAAGIKQIHVDTMGIGVVVADHLNHVDIDGEFTIVEHPLGITA